jgi:ligand-binding sensor domain-containing protein/signal transduction histidine kinase
MVNMSFALASNSTIHFEHISNENGLPHNKVKTVLRDTHGFLWVGSTEGLTRFDGYAFKTFKNIPNDPYSLSNNVVRVIFEDSLGNIWVGTREGGLNRFDSRTEQFIHYDHDVADSNSLSDNYVRAIAEDQKGNLWVGTDAGGLNRFEPNSGQFTHYIHDANNPNSISDDNVYTIVEGPKGNLWVGTRDGGLNRFNTLTEEFRHFRFNEADANSLSHDWVSVITKGRQGKLWVGTSGGINYFDIHTEKFSRFTHNEFSRNSLSHDWVSAIVLDQQNHVWVGTWGGGLNRFDPKTERFTHYRRDTSNPGSINNDRIYSLAHDEQGILWIGTYSGLDRFKFKTEKFNHYRHSPDNPTGLSDNDVSAIMEDKQGNVWVGTLGGGLSWLDQETEEFIQYQHDASNTNSLSHNGILAIIEDHRGNLWIGTEYGGLNRFNPKTEKFTHYRHNPKEQNSISSDRVFAVFEDSQGILWVGTWRGGVNRFDPRTEEFTHYQHEASNPYSLSDNRVTVIIEGQKGILWLGTPGGLNRFNPKTEEFHHYRHDAEKPTSLSNDAVRAIVTDKKGNLWVGTANGLDILNVKTDEFRHINENQGLLDSVIGNILEDDFGHLWFSTNRGLSRYNPVTEHMSNYDKSNGLQSNTFLINAANKGPRGELFFGGINGFNRFFPEYITKDNQQPAVVLTDMLLMNHSVPIRAKQSNGKFERLANQAFTLEQAIHLTQKITLTHLDNLVSFEFSALDFTNLKKNRYAYRLQGWDNEWITTDYKKRFATYTNLPSGDFALQVKASNSEGVWNEEGVSLQITVLPPPWKSWWAYSIYTALLAGLVLTFIRVQQSKVILERKINLQLENKVAERTVELKNKNREMLDTQQQLIQSEKMAGLGTLTAGVAHEINNPINFTHVSVHNLRAKLEQLLVFLKELAGGDDADEEIIATIVGKFGELNEITDTAEQGTTRIKAIVKDLRTFTQLDESDKKHVHLIELIESTINLIRTQYSTIELVATLDVNPEVECFPAKLSQVFMNVIVNGCYAVSRRQISEPDLSAKVQVIMKQCDDWIHIKISDNGCGMNDAIKQKIFEPFFTTKDVGVGTGLGMAVTFGIVEEHSGKIEVESNVNQGTTITIKLPLH